MLGILLQIVKNICPHSVMSITCNLPFTHSSIPYTPLQQGAKTDHEWKQYTGIKQ